MNKYEQDQIISLLSCMRAEYVNDMYDSFSDTKGGEVPSWAVTELQDLSVTAVEFIADNEYLLDTWYKYHQELKEKAAGFFWGVVATKIHAYKGKMTRKNLLDAFLGDSVVVNEWGIYDDQ